MRAPAGWRWTPPKLPGRVFNVGSGHRYTIRTVAQRMAGALGQEHIRPEINGKYRVGDIRHCFADISLARDILGYRPHVSLEEGLVDMASWLEKQTASDRVAEASQELAARGLVV